MTAMAVSMAVPPLSVSLRVQPMPDQDHHRDQDGDDFVAAPRGDVDAPVNGYDEHIVDYIEHWACRQSPFNDLVTRAALRSFYYRGLLRELVPFVMPVVRIGLDPFPEGTPAVKRLPTIEELEAVEDLEMRAWAILTARIHATCERTRALIVSVKDAGWLGAVAQGNLLPPEPPGPKIYPYWYRPPNKQKPLRLPGFFTPGFWEN